MAGGSLYSNEGLNQAGDSTGSRSTSAPGGTRWCSRTGAVTAAATAAATETAEGDLDVVGLTQDSRLISFQDDEPGNARDIGRINGLAGDARLVGIDYRPATGNNGSQGVLYGLGNAGGVYTSTPAHGRPRSPSSASLSREAPSAWTSTPPSTGCASSVTRAEPASQRGRAGRNPHRRQAHLPARASAQPNPTPATGVTGAAYTNNDGDPNTATTLFDIDSTLDQTVIQSPANSGMLAAIRSGASSG